MLQRVRLAEPQAGIWDAADVQWWWRKPRESDDVAQLFWVDGRGPVACVLLTTWDEFWQCDPIVVPRADLELEAVWERALQEIHRHAEDRVDVPVEGNDLALRSLVERAGFVPGQRSSTAWMEAADRPGVQSLPDGFVLVDRARRSGTPHPMRHRNGDAVEARLSECPLYDPELDLAVESVDGRVAGYSLYWFDPVTKTGLVEPVRVEGEYQRRGLARAMLTEGIDRLAAKGARRVKIGFESEAAGALYQGIGFRPTSRDTWYEAAVERLMAPRAADR